VLGSFLLAIQGAELTMSKELVLVLPDVDKVHLLCSYSAVDFTSLFFFFSFFFFFSLVAISHFLHLRLLLFLLCN